MSRNISRRSGRTTRSTQTEIRSKGRGSKAQPTRTSIDAYIKNQTERRGSLGPEKGYEENLARMEADLEAYNASKPQPVKRRPARPSAA